MALYLLFIMSVMKIAIPIYGDRVSPRFDCSNSFSLISIENGKIVERNDVLLPLDNPITGIEGLIKLKVDILICGAINGFTVRMLHDKGIKVIPWIIGEIDKIVEAFISGELKPGFTFAPDGRKYCRRMRMGKGGRWKNFN